MGKWRVYYHTGASAVVDVQAESREDAWEVAEKEFDSPQPCYHCSRHFELGDWEPVEEEWGTVELDD